jgi:hypothetical protein
MRQQQVQKTTLNMQILTPQQSRIQAALDNETAKLKGQLMGKQPVEEDSEAKMAKVSTFSESYY